MITEMTPGQWIAVVDGPVTLAELIHLAAELPEGAVMTDSEVDGDGRLYATFEVHRVVSLD
ncbi:hypothetical protein [Micromonospora sp. NPDC005367]|uniref:hypothetical protein n=1 Tax=Micromonospora sp. NPDC005367 TaxID=3155590 RepID=UPI0033A79E7A